MNYFAQNRGFVTVLERKVIFRLMGVFFMRFFA